jgi:hypothetical protein
VPVTSWRNSDKEWLAHFSVGLHKAQAGEATLGRPVKTEGFGKNALNILCHGNPLYLTNLISYLYLRLYLVLIFISTAR